MIRKRPVIRRVRRVGLTAFLAAGAVVVWTAALAAAQPPGAVQLKLTTLSNDPYTNPEAFHQTELGADTYAFGKTVVSVFQAGRFYDGAADNIGFATTTDAGKSWTHGFMPGTTVYADPAGPYERINNPSVAFDAKHKTWLAASAAAEPVPTYSFVVNRSTDGGLTWQKPVVIAKPPEGGTYTRGWITCDNWPKSPNYGNCYGANSNSTFEMFRSKDGGLTWTTSEVPFSYSLGPQPVVRPDGTVVVTQLASQQITSVISKDGGKTYTGPYFVASWTDPHGRVPFMRTYTHPSSEVDDEGNIYVVWQDCIFRPKCATNDIVMSTSPDGVTWSETVRIPIDGVDSTATHFLPGIAVDRETGGGTAAVGLSYYYFPTTDCTERTCKLYAGYVSSTDGGAHWSDPTRVLGPVRLNWLPFIYSVATPGRFLGDYSSASIVNGRAYPVLPTATKGNCEVDREMSCDEHMVAPSGGLAVRPGSNPVELQTSIRSHAPGEEQGFPPSRDWPADIDQ